MTASYLSNKGLMDRNEEIDMKHKLIQKKLLCYLDGDLSEREKVQVQRHLESCPECRDALKTVESMWAIEQPIERKTVAPFLWTRISSRLHAEAKQGFFKGSKKPVRLALRPLVTAVVLIFIFYSGIKLGNLITGSTSDVSQVSAENTIDNFGMSYFDILPPGSINAQVLVLIESEMEE